MKIRNGFVSNSSSSSFVILGFEEDDLRQKEDEPDECFDDRLDEFHCRDDVFTFDGDYVIIGEKLTRCHDWGLEDEVWNIKDIVTKAEILAKEHGISVDEIGIYMGTRPC